MATTSAPSSATTLLQPTAKAQRMLSLDVFRGATVAAMILVNNPGTWSAIYPPLKHAEWHGWTPTDLIFPFFLFIVGVSMVLSFESRQQKGSSRRELALHVLRRSAIIFAIGFFLNAFPYFDLGRVRVPGVLQRIALCYLAAGLVVLFTGKRARAGIVAGLLFGYWAAMTLIPVPGYGAGALTPEGNLAAYVDRIFLTGHMWRTSWDPEGLLSTLPAIATTLLGAAVGAWLRVAGGEARVVRGLLAMGAAGLALGWLWGQAFPINKYLWTSSYVVFTAGFACACLAACYWLVDVRGWRRWARPFTVFGVNAIAAFGLSTFVTKNLIIYKLPAPDGRATSVWNWMYLHWFAPLASPVNASLLMAVCYLALWTAVMWWMDRKRIYVKV